MESWRKELYSSELCHHGILGQKWGVRRYQNKDGSYTKKGLARYKKAEDKYTDTKEKYKEARTFNTPLGEMDASIAVAGAGLLAEMGIGLTAHSAEKKLRAYYAH